MTQQATYKCFAKNSGELIIVISDSKQATVKELNKQGKRIVQLIVVRDLKEINTLLALVEWEEKNAAKTS